MLDVHVACDQSRALVAHAPQHSFPALVDERDLIKIYDAFATLGRGACPFPGRLQFLDPWRDEPAWQGPQLMLRRVGDGSLQHPFLLPRRWIMQIQRQ